MSKQCMHAMFQDGVHSSLNATVYSLALAEMCCYSKDHLVNYIAIFEFSLTISIARKIKAETACLLSSQCLCKVGPEEGIFVVLHAMTEHANILQPEQSCDQ